MQADSTVRGRLTTLCFASNDLQSASNALTVKSVTARNDSRIHDTNGCRRASGINISRWAQAAGPHRQLREEIQHEHSQVPLARFLLASIAAITAASTPAVAQQQQQKPNILVIMGDDIGYWNISSYNRGMMGYRTPNIDRIANEGAIFTDYYG
jgi:hypothetical protein